MDMALSSQVRAGLAVRIAGLGTALTLAACTAAGGADQPSVAGQTTHPGPTLFQVSPLATLDRPWAMAFLPDGRALVTERGGTLLLVDPTQTPQVEPRVVSGTPSVVDSGQGGLGDVILAPSFARDGAIYLSWVEAGPGGTGAVVGRATLVDGDSPQLADLHAIWHQDPKTSGSGHFSHRMVISPDEKYLFVSSGERQKGDPAQHLDVNLGKVLRLNLDGSAAEGNPFARRGGVSAQIWTLGHRNVLGLDFDPDGNLWASEMGPRGGDELNLIEPGDNYGWPTVSDGSRYDGRDIPDHAEGDGFTAPKVWWTPSVSPSGLMIYRGDLFPDWTGDAFLPALSGEALIRVDLDGTQASKADEWSMGARIREVDQAPDGTIYLLEDGSGGRLLRLTPER